MYIFLGMVVLLLSVVLLCTIVKYKREITLFSRELDNTLDDMNGMISFSCGKLPVIEVIADFLAQVMPLAEQKISP